MSYYVSRKSKLLNDFDRTAALLRDRLIQRYGEEFTDTLHRESRREYENLIPEVPFIRDARARALNSFLLITAQEVAVYQAMKRHGRGPSEAWEICHEATKRRMETFSNVKRWLSAPSRPSIVIVIPLPIGSRGIPFKVLSRGA
jgi:hypothetical protein